MTVPVHVAVVGGSGSGKTWLAEKLAAALAPHAARLSLDDFYRDLSPLPLAAREQVNFDNPASIDWETLRVVIAAMRIAKNLELPAYDFATHTRQPATRHFSPPPLVIWDGLWLLHHEWVREHFALTLFVECGAAERFRRRAERDVRERGRTLESVRRQFDEHVEPMHEQFVEPQRNQASQLVTSPVSPADVESLVRKMLTFWPHLTRSSQHP